MKNIVFEVTPNLFRLEKFGYLRLHRQEDYSAATNVSGQ